jgi:2-methylcitrate dehydratase PrpD
MLFHEAVWLEISEPASQRETLTTELNIVFKWPTNSLEMLRPEAIGGRPRIQDTRDEKHNMTHDNTTHHDITRVEVEGFERRRFLRGVVLAAGAASLTSEFVGSAVAASALPATVEVAGHDSGQTVRLAEYAVGLRYEAIPGEVLQRAKDCITDTVATILFGAQFPWSKMIIAQATRMGSGGACAILGTGARVCAPAAALAHGAMTHAFEQDNLTFPDSGAHPGASLVTSGLAVAQELGTSGRDLLTAFVAGAEVMIRIGRATKRTNEVRGFHAPGTLGPFGAAIVSGKLMRLDAPKMTNAIGIAASTSGGLLEFAHSGNGAMVKRLHMGRAAEGGVLAASLAADGFTGPSTALEGGAGFLKAFCNESDFAELTRGLGEKFLTSTIMMKRFACHITAHTPVEAILDLREKYGFSASDVASIQIAGSQRMATTNNIPAPPDILIAQFSIPFCVALAMVRNPIDPYSFDEVAVHDRSLQAMASLVRVTAAPGQAADDVSSTVSVTLKDGRLLTQRVTEFLGTPARPLTGRDLRQKFLLLTQKYPAKPMERLLDRLQNIEAESNLDWVRA